MNGVIWLALAFCLSTLASALFSGAEMAILASDPATLRGRVKMDSRAAIVVEKFLARPQWFLSAALVGATLSMVTATAPVAIYMLERKGMAGAGLAFLVAAPLFIFFGRALPKLFFQTRPHSLAIPSLIALRYMTVVFAPLIAPMLALGWLVGRGSGQDREHGAFWYTRDQLKLLLTRPASLLDLDREERLMIDRVFDFRETQVDDVMIPLVEVEAFEEKTKVEEALGKICESPHSRYPIYRDRIDNVTGILESVDLLEVGDRSARLSAWVRKCRYVPYGKPVDELLFSMQRENFDLAVVVDEYGGCVGIVTREDIIEEIVGEIEDEHDEPVSLYKRLDQKRVLVNARMEIDEINEILEWDIPEGDYETLGGFLLFRFRRVPAVGERVRFEDLVFTIKEASDRAIQSVEVEQEV